MIFEPIFELVIEFLYDLPPLTIASDFTILHVVWNVLEVVCYLIPVHAFIPLIMFSLAVTTFKIVCNFIRMIWSLLPIT